MRKLIIGLMVVGLLGIMAGIGNAATDNANVNLYVTPIVVTSLVVSPTYYDFGPVDVGITTGTVTTLVLTNDGNVGIAVEKEIMADDNWDITLSSAVENGFDLWAMVSVSQPSHAAFETGSSIFSKAGLSVMNNLTDTTGSQVSMSADETNNLWFRLDMPYAVLTSNEQKLQLRLTATSQ